MASHDHDPPATGQYCPGCRQPVRDHLGLDVTEASNQPATLLDVLYCTRCQYTFTVARHPQLPAQSQPALTTCHFSPITPQPPVINVITPTTLMTSNASAGTATSAPGQPYSGPSSISGVSPEQ